MKDKLFAVEGKVALVTGASSGIGKEIAYMLAERGCNGILVARRKKNIDNMAAEFKNMFGTEWCSIQCDVSKEEEVLCTVAAGIKRFGKIDILINNAGTTEKSRDITEHTTTQWDKVISTNLNSAYYFTREVANSMKETRYGKIINIASVCGIMGLHNQASYVASKSGLIGLTKACAVELGEYNITVNAVAPGYLLTELTNENSGGCRYFKSRTVNDRVGTPRDLLGVILLLASDASSYITGTVIPVDGGILANI